MCGMDWKIGDDEERQNPHGDLTGKKGSRMEVREKNKCGKSDTQDLNARGGKQLGEPTKNTAASHKLQLSCEENG